MPDPGVPLVPARLARGARGAVVAPHHLATQAGLSILAAGGSAVDAAIATNAVLAVVMPNGCGLGGDAFWLVWDETAGEQVALNGSGRAPLATDADALRGRGLTRLPLRGPLSITVPGAVRSWGDAHRRWGRLSWEAVLAPAIEQAEGGFPAWDGLIAAVEGLVAEVGERVVGSRARADVARAGAAVAARRAGPPAGARPHAAHPRGPGVRRLLRRRARGADRPRPQRRGGAVHARRPARAPLDLGPPDRDHVPRRPRHHPPAQLERPHRARDPQRPRAVRADRRARASAGVAGPIPRGSTSSSRPPSSPSPTATRTSPIPRRTTSRWTGCARRSTPPGSRRGSMPTARTPPLPRRARWSAGRSTSRSSTATATR